MRLAMRRGALPMLVCLLAIVLAPAAQASRPLVSAATLETTEGVKPPPEGQIEGACGAAVAPGGNVYVADYHHRVIDVFGGPSASMPYMFQIALPGSNPTFGVNTLDAVCGLAFDAAGNLYGNEWHRGVLRLTGGEATIDSGESTGLAIDPSTNRLYVDDRTYVAEYALPFAPGDEPLAQIGLGSLGEGFGLAAAGGLVYVADAADQTVKVFEAATPLATPVATIAGQFNSLTDAALAIDPSNGHLLVVDNLQPGFEQPKSAVLEFDSAAGAHAFLGPLPGAPIHGAPSGIAVAASGQVVVTDGNSERSNAFLYGSYQASAGFAGGSETTPSLNSLAATRGDPAEQGEGAAESPSRAGSASASEVSQHGGVRVSFQGDLAPRALPRRGSWPVSASVGAKIVAVDGRTPPQLRKIEIAINRNGHFAPGAVPG